MPWWRLVFDIMEGICPIGEDAIAKAAEEILKNVHFGNDEQKRRAILALKNTLINHQRETKHIGSPKNAAKLLCSLVPDLVSTSAGGAEGSFQARLPAGMSEEPQWQIMARDATIQLGLLKEFKFIVGWRTLLSPP